MPLKLGTIQVILGQFPVALVGSIYNTGFCTTIFEELNFSEFFFWSGQIQGLTSQDLLTFAPAALLTKGHEPKLYETVTSAVGLVYNIYLLKHDKDQINTLNLKEGGN